MLAFLSKGQGDLDNEGSNSLEHDRHYRQKGKDTGVAQASDFGFGENVEAIFGGRIDPLRSGAQGF